MRAEPHGVHFGLALVRDPGLDQLLREDAASREELVIGLERVEFRCPDAAANPYLAFSAMLMAGLDGVEQGLDPGKPADFDLFEEEADVPQVPASLGEALDALETDHEFLTRGGVFSKELIETWIAYKRETEVDAVRLRPHPAEFALYFDA